MTENDDTDANTSQLPPELRFLKVLVIALTGTMILGIALIAGLLAYRLSADPMPLPQRITLPDGAAAIAYTEGTDWIAVVTDRDEIVIYDRATGALRQTIVIEAE